MELSRKQFKYELSKDSINKLQALKVDSESRRKFRYQDSLNKHQDYVNNEQLKNFKTQTLTGKQQLEYFKKQTSIAETQLKNADIVYQNQLNENKPSFTIQDFAIDSNKNKPKLTIKFNVYNSGKRNAYIRKLSSFAWNLESNRLNYNNIPVAGEAILPATHDAGTFPIDEKVELGTKTIIMFQIFYKDELSKQIQVFRMFTIFNELKPILSVQVDEEIQRKFLSRIRQAEIYDKIKYLDY